MKNNRKYNLFSNSKASWYKCLKYTGLPLGSVLLTILFNVYSSDIAYTISRKLIYADDNALIAQESRYGEWHTKSTTLFHQISFYS
jgi:hypothetical protein